MPKVRWSDEAERSLLAAPVADAERVVEAVERLAATGRGFVRDMLDGAGTYGLYVEGYVALFVVDRDGSVRVDSVRARAGSPGRRA